MDDTEREKGEDITQMSWNVGGVDYKYIERNVRLIPLYRKQLKAFEHDIIFSTPERDDNGGGKSNLPSRPVENIVFNLYENARMKRIREYIDYVDQAYRELDKEKQRFINALFWGNHNMSVQGICTEFNITPVTYLRWKKSFLNRVGLLTGDKM
jgi:RinA family phage transcriptional activator